MGIAETIYRAGGKPVGKTVEGDTNPQNIGDSKPQETGNELNTQTKTNKIVGEEKKGLAIILK